MRDLRYDFPKIEAWLEGGEEIIITKHSKPIARIQSERAVEKPMLKHADYEARLKKT